MNERLEHKVSPQHETWTPDGANKKPKGTLAFRPSPEATRNSQFRQVWIKARVFHSLNAQPFLFIALPSAASYIKKVVLLFIFLQLAKEIFLFFFQ